MTVARDVSSLFRSRGSAHSLPRPRSVALIAIAALLALVPPSPGTALACGGGEQTVATPVLVRGRILLRTYNHLYCIGK